MKPEAIFVTSAATAGDMPRDGLPELALVGRSNVGKSTLINALLRRRLARTSGAPGKTRLANVYRVQRGGSAFYVVDLPGYGFARGDRTELARVTAEYFGRGARQNQVAALLLVDARHPGLPQDVAAWGWLQAGVEHCALVATKMDKLSRAERLRATKVNEAVFEHPVLPVSAETGEGLDELWKLIDRLLPNRKPRQPHSRPQPDPTAAAGRPRHPRRKN